MSWLGLIPKAFAFLFSGVGRLVMKILALKLLMTSLVTVVFAVVLLSAALQQSVKQHSIKPFVLDFGELTLNTDKRIGEEVLSIRQDSISLARFFLMLSGEIWVFVILVRAWYWILNFVSGSQMSPIILWMLVFVFLGLFQIVYSAVIEQSFYVPFSGVYSLITSIFIIINFAEIKDWMLSLVRRA